ncbi:hypothetical protein PsorP6_007013 [Peronosclerospora sorghi]|uniref:Uncharacterized protein n=1 Tax=Peronosclerospora sorghi TaxID=230839 RepID=A0ACC0WED1_9STRA|nr:hypothetical protein PsorP6_007013 [Peronosclerospora sorghi]
MDDAQTGSVPFRASMLHKDFWLEALDPQHRYGFHLRAFHQAWLDEMDAMRETTCASQDTSFFHWLDYGNGRHVHVPACSQSHLRTTFVHYCSEDERKRYELAFVSHGQNVCVQYAASGRTVHTDERSKWIFVLDLAGRMYLSRKRKGKFHHSSFVSGAPILAAGKIIIKHGVIRAVEPHSGHFKPRLENLLVLCFVLTNHGVDMDGVALVKPKKWTCDWPFPSQPHLELEDFVGASDTDDGVDKSEAEDTQTLLLPAR